MVMRIGNKTQWRKRQTRIKTIYLTLPLATDSARSVYFVRKRSFFDFHNCGFVVFQFRRYYIRKCRVFVGFCHIFGRRSCHIFCLLTAKVSREFFPSVASWWTLLLFLLSSMLLFLMLQAGFGNKHLCWVRNVVVAVVVVVVVVHSGNVIQRGTSGRNVE